MTITQTCVEPVELNYVDGLPVRSGGHCDFTLNIGLFFDGTDNNRERDKPAQAQSNVARLYDAYHDEVERGFFRHYIPGVGTPFKELGTTGDDILEAAMGKGGQPRILWGLLQILNSVYRFISKDRNKVMFNNEQMRALCSEVWVTPDHSNEWPLPIPIKEERILKELGVNSGLVDSEDARTKFFLKQTIALGNKYINQPIQITGIYIDVFGFSRGAAQARVFTNWLHQHLLLGGKFMALIPSYVRTLGLFDTVASVGIPNKISHGHWSWATPANLRIHKDVKNCVHYVALHELRTVFPCDSIVIPGEKSEQNRFEIYYPGTHSDVGGSYSPGSQGKGVYVTPGIYDPPPKPEKRDSLKLSQLPLNDMLDVARKFGQFNIFGNPWLDPQSVAGIEQKIEEQFLIDEKVRRDVVTYFANCGIKQHVATDAALRDHGALYLAWRYRVHKKNGFEALPSVSYAQQLNAESLLFYRKGQVVFAEQVHEMENQPSGIDLFGERRRHHIGYSHNARKIFAGMQKTSVDDAVHYFFDAYVHDSYAGFIQKLGSERKRENVEGQGYLRYRVLYQGSNRELNALHEAPQQTRLA